ncbi:MAG TPA: methyltransferase domain-containing protein [Burkholderiales bacterium]|nr:methyltransferase domain-containing protein [Burkholderiales bacterium]
MNRVFAFLLLCFVPLSTGAQDLQPTKDAGPYVPSPQSVVADMLRYADVGPDDFLIDLGSGDGRIVLTAAKVFGARGFGVEIKDHLVKQANEAAHKEGIADRAKFLKQDLFKTDVSQATVITMYLLPDTVNLLKDKFLQELRPGTRIVSHDYPLTGWIPEKYLQMDLEDKVQISGVTTTLIYLYVVPAKVEGRWSAKMPSAVSRQPATLQLRQELTRVSGSVRLDGKDVPLEEFKLRGDKISFRLSGRRGEFTGQVRGTSIEGEVVNGRARETWSATLGG